MDIDKKSHANIVEEYMRYLKLERSFSPNTLDAYRRDLMKLDGYLSSVKISPFDVRLEEDRKSVV